MRRVCPCRTFGVRRTSFARSIRRGFDQAARRAILGDYAPWIWNTATELFPNAIQIADRYQVKERICTIAKAIYGPADPQAKQWAKLRHDELDAENVDAIIQALTEHRQTCDEARKGIDYFHNNRHLHAVCGISRSGTVHFHRSCEHLKLSGMHWTVRGADAIIALRCSRLSGRFEDFWEHRSAHQKAA